MYGKQGQINLEKVIWKWIWLPETKDGQATYGFQG